MFACFHKWVRCIVCWIRNKKRQTRTGWLQYINGGLESRVDTIRWWYIFPAADADRVKALFWIGFVFFLYFVICICVLLHFVFIVFVIFYFSCCWCRSYQSIVTPDNGFVFFVFCNIYLRTFVFCNMYLWTFVFCICCICYYLIFPDADADRVKALWHQIMAWREDRDKKDNFFQHIRAASMTMMRHVNTLKRLKWKTISLLHKSCVKVVSKLCQKYVKVESRYEIWS